MNTAKLLTAAAMCAGLALGTPLPAQAADTNPNGTANHFDLQAHRGGIGLTVESTLPAFAKALETGVTTLELDLQITKDGREVITHDRKISDKKCADTAPATPGDPLFPYAGKYVKDLTFDQVRTLDCGSLTLPEFPGQQAAPGEKMPTLAEVFALVDSYRASQVKFNIETKVEAGAPEQTAPREQFVAVALKEIKAANMQQRVSIQSFDWGSLRLIQAADPRIRTVALTNKDFLQAGQPGSSPWLGGIDADDFGGDLVNAASHLGFDAISPVHGTPQNGTVEDPGYVPYVTADMVNRAHDAGMQVMPWTVDDKPTMRALISAGVDGIITDYPDRLREVMAEHSMKLPKQYSLEPGAV
ncbi:glycerophosphoryl diester phosphodiesterase [Arthrobacter sp. PvP102]|uniref:glycerophosphodiester phosphodiesterase n=1 Tax=unclassified Arthrobacter TaxID=235627 RepID=UPI001AE57557|nr:MULTISPECIES: glycerophosphodiester phosphodiesterase [unclassified Arthrobacter]MBP1234490.1 glycerophosphoryl diester phosphodiesterase [Arthrobacter sp. PvP103]MBP1239624.1 glycerophosphoryl diester phosphodiesterase [Arthrobacter sp. PvP102]